jgi:hypothetical protein
MAELPIPGADSGTWGNILNSFLEVAHNSDGTLIGSAITQAGGLTQSSADGRYQRLGTAAGGDLSGTYPSPTVQKLNGTTIANTPSTGQVLVATSGTAASWQTMSSGSGSSTLAGDTDVAISSPTNNQVLTYNAVAGKWENSTAASGVSLDAIATDIQQDVLSTTAIAGSTGKAADAGHQHPLVAHDHTTTTRGGQIPVASLSTTGTASNTTYLRGDGTWNTPAGGAVTSVFTRTGAVTSQSGDYTAAQVGALANTSDLSSIATNNVTAANVAMNNHKLTGLANGTLSSDAVAFGQVPVVGTAGSGASNALSANDASTTNSRTPTGTAGGDLAGTYPSPTIGSIQGIAVSGAPVTGDILTATSTSAATWSVPGGPADWLNVKTYGAKGDGVTDDTTALTNAFAAGNTQLVPVYLPPGTYVVSSLIDLSSQNYTNIIGASVNTSAASFNGAGIYGGATTITQSAANTSTIRFGGYTDVSNISFLAPLGTTNAGMELANVSNGSRFTNLRIQGGANCISLPQQSFGGNGNWGAFSTSFTDIRLSAPVQRFINWQAYNNSTTGNVFKNIYCNADGSTPPTQGAIYFLSADEMEFIQLNIEGIAFIPYGGLITLTDCGGFSFDGIHFERATGGAAANSHGWQAFIYAYQTASMNIRNVTVKYSTMQNATTKVYLARGENTPYHIRIHNVTTGNNTLSAGIFYLANYGSATDTVDAAIYIDDITDTQQSVEFGANIGDTDLATSATRQPIRRVGSHVFSEFMHGGNFMCYTTGGAPTGGTWAVGDQVQVTSPTIAGTSGTQYMVVGYRCTTAGTPGTWTAERVLTGT